MEIRIISPLIGRRCAWSAHSGLKNHRRTFDPFPLGHAGVALRILHTRNFAYLLVEKRFLDAVTHPAMGHWTSG